MNGQKTPIKHTHMHSTQRHCYMLVSLHTSHCSHYHRANGALGHGIDELTVSPSWQVLRRDRLSWAILQALDHMSSECVCACVC